MQVPIAANNLGALPGIKKCRAKLESSFDRALGLAIALRELAMTATSHGCLPCVCSEGLRNAAQFAEPPPYHIHEETDKSAEQVPDGDAAAAWQLAGKYQAIPAARAAQRIEEPRSKSAGAQQLLSIHAANMVAVSALKTKVEALRVEASTPGALNGN